MLVALAVALAAALLALWFANYRTARLGLTSISPASASAYTRSELSERRSAVAAEVTTDIAFVQLPLSVLTVLFLAWSVIATQQSLRLAKDANKTARDAVEMEERGRRLSMRAHLTPRLTEGTTLNMVQYIDQIAPCATFRVALDNSGPTAAVNLLLASSARVVADIAEMASMNMSHLRPFPDVAANRSDVITLHQTLFEAANPSLPVGLRLFIRVRVTYDDVFGVNHGFDYMWELTQPQIWFIAFQNSVGTIGINIDTLSEHCSAW